MAVLSLPASSLFLCHFVRCPSIALQNSVSLFNCVQTVDVMCGSRSFAFPESNPEQNVALKLPMRLPRGPLENLVCFFFLPVNNKDTQIIRFMQQVQLNGGHCYIRDTDFPAACEHATDDC